MAKHNRLNATQRCRVSVNGQQFFATVGDLVGNGFQEVLATILQQRKQGRKCIGAVMWVNGSPHKTCVQIDLIQDPAQPLVRQIEADPRVKAAVLY